MSAPVRSPTHVRPRPPRRPKKRHGIGILVFIAIWVGLGIWSATQNSRHHHTYATDRSDLVVVPASVVVPAGRSGVVALRLDNSGPDDLDHTVTFTITAVPGLTITGPGSIDEGGRFPYIPDEDCTLAPGGARLTCDWFVDIDQGRHDLWHIPVRVESGSAPGTSLPLRVNAVGNSLYTDPDTSNNTGISYPVQVSRPGSRPPATPSPSRSSAPPSVPRGTVTTPAASHPGTGKRIRNAARDAVAPVSIVAAAVVGLALLIVIALSVVARRQRRLPLNYVPPRRERRF